MEQTTLFTRQALSRELISNGSIAWCLTSIYEFEGHCVVVDVDGKIHAEAQDAINPLLSIFEKQPAGDRHALPLRVVEEVLTRTLKHKQSREVQVFVSGFDRSTIEEECLECMSCGVWDAAMDFKAPDGFPLPLSVRCLGGVWRQYDPKKVLCWLHETSAK